MEMSGPLLLIGCGKMGGALLSGWLGQGLKAERVFIVEPATAAVADFVAQGCRHLETPADLPEAPRLVMLAVKPQMMGDALAGLTALAGPETLFLSIAAGIKLESLSQALGAETKIVRAMPNTPAAVGRGMSVLVAGPGTTPDDRKLAEDLLATVGETAWVEEEGQLDAVTALSGGGPAYVFLLAEVLAQAGVAAGLPEGLAARLARVTVAGSGELLHQASEPPSVLRRNVTSPGGTTQEALRVLMADDALQPLVTRAIAAATRRSRELGG
ncbi:MAG: pyrroline-5-carboxylate reductase [Rhodospirillales bacterium]